MDKYITTFPHQLTEALGLGEKIKSLKYPNPIENIILSGMGGSGIGGAIVKEYLQQTLLIPVTINNDYNLPAFAGRTTLVICSSYSGETVEALSVLQEALKKKCKIICISSGGTMLEKAVQGKLPFIKIPGGMPPRTCVGYSIVFQLFFLMKAGLIKKTFIKETEIASQALFVKHGSIREKAKNLAKKIQDKIPVIYTSASLQSTAIRWKQQLNENPEVHCFVNVLPEMNHNELVAYRDENKDIAVIYLRSKIDAKAIQRRFDLSKKLIAQKVDAVHEIYAEGESMLERIFYLIHFGDWVSYYLAEFRKVDAVQITSLEWLKKQLSKK
ncbi:MAG: bifunctional phosphoglucose/phosphomannose isomerase [Chitinophagales bacterium]